MGMGFAVAFLLSACSSGSSGTSSSTTGASSTTAGTTGSGTGTGAGSSTTGTSSGSTTGTSGSTQNFPSTSTIYQDISSASLDPSSSDIIGALADAGGWGTPKFQIDFGITILHAGDMVQPRPFTANPGYFSPDCDSTKVPIPPGGNAEGVSDYNCDSANEDCHLLVYQGQRLYELYKANIPNGLASGGPLTATCEVVWDLTHDYWQPGTPYSRGDQCTSADAAGMPIAPLLATGAELQAGLVPHALRFTLPNPKIRSGVYLHPGTHAGGPTGNDLMPAYVSRFRLRSDFDMSALPNDAARAVARALQVYGMFLDDGGNVPLTLDQSAAAYLGSHDLQALAVTDFEIVASPDPPVTLTYDCQRTPLTQ
jgi:serine/threonine-protein kinase